MQVEEKEIMTNNVSTLTTAITNFTQSLTGRNVSPHTITAYPAPRYQRSGQETN